MKNLCSIFIFAFCLAGAVIAAPAMPDLRLTMQKTIEWTPPSTTSAGNLTGDITQAPAEPDVTNRYQIPVVSWFISGRKSRVDVSPTLSITSDGNRKIITINRADKTYFVTRCKPAQIKAVFLNKTAAAVALSEIYRSPEVTTSSGQGGYVEYGFDPDSTASPAKTAERYKVIDTQQTTTLLGHKVHHYIATMSNAQPNNQGTMSERIDILAAQDLPPAEIAEYKSMSMDDPYFSHISGIPLETTTTVTFGHSGQLITKQVVTSISTKQLPASIFAIPSGYKQTKPPAGAP